MIETETVGPCLVRKLIWGAMAALLSPVATPLLITFLKLQLVMRHRTEDLL